MQVAKLSINPSTSVIEVRNERKGIVGAGGADGGQGGQRDRGTDTGDRWGTYVRRYRFAQQK